MILSVLSINDVFGQTSEPVITQFTTDKTSYTSGETIIISGHIDNYFSNYDAIYHINAPNGPTVFQNSATIDGNGDFSTSIIADPTIFVACVNQSENLYDNCETYPLEGTYDIIVIHVAGSITASTSFEYVILISEPQDGPFVLPCSMQEKGDGVSAFSCNGFYQNSIARAEVGINYHSGLFPIKNYKAVGYFIDKNGNQGQNITVTLDKINPGESKTLVFTNPSTGFVSEFKMQMLGGTLVTETPDTIPPVIVVPNNMAIQTTSNNPSPVTFSVSATDDKDGPIISTCSPKSGTTFVIGKTIVTCTATDKTGNTTTKSFTVTVTSTSSTDTDSDGIPDSTDSCPTQKETFNGYQDSDGCPDVVSSTNQVTIVPALGSGAPGCEDTIQGCYLPKSVSINVGGIVIFKNTDTAAHTWTAGSQPDGPSGEFDTSLVISGSSYEWKPNIAGTFPYYCMVHPWMNGEIIVGGGTNTLPQPESKITVSTNKSKYNEGDTVIISGKLIGPIPEKVTIQIFNQHNLVDIAQTIVAKDGSYSHTMLVQGPLWYNAGEYTLKVSFGDNISAKTLFFFNGSSDENTIPPTSDDLPFEIKITPTPGSSSPGCEETSQGCFIPRYASVATGGKVIFSNTDTAAHTFTAGTAAEGPSGEFDTSLVISGSSYEWTATTVGEFPYYCMVHPWREGILFVGKSPYPIPEPEPELISLNLVIEPKIYDIGNTVSLKMSLEGVSSPHDIGIDISDVTGKTIISRSVTTSSSGAAGLDIKIAENFKAGTYRVVATTSVDGKTLKESTQFIVKSQYNQFKVTSVESTNQQGIPAPLKAGEIGFIKVNLESNKSITTLVTVNLFDSDLTSIGIGSIKTTLSSGNSEIILSFMIPKDAALGPADIYVNAFSDWPSNNGIPLTKEFTIQENIQ